MQWKHWFVHLNYNKKKLKITYFLLVSENVLITLCVLRGLFNPQHYSGKWGHSSVVGSALIQSDEFFDVTCRPNF